LDAKLYPTTRFSLEKGVLFSQASHSVSKAVALTRVTRTSQK